MLDLRLGTAGGGSAPGIIFYDSFEGIALGGNELSNQVSKSVAQLRIYQRALTREELGACSYAEASVDQLLMSGSEQTGIDPRFGAASTLVT